MPAQEERPNASHNLGAGARWQSSANFSDISSHTHTHGLRSKTNSICIRRNDEAAISQTRALALTLAVTAASLGVAAATVMLSAPASASNSDGNCEFNEVYYLNTFDYRQPSCFSPCWQNEQVSSAMNRSDHRDVALYEYKNYSGRREVLNEYESHYHVIYNDAYSSHCWNDGGIQQTSCLNF